MDTLAYITQKFHISLNGNRNPFEIPNIGRDQLPGLFHELGLKTGVEVGVEQGVYSEILCKGNLGVKLFCVDPWQHYRGYRDHVNQEKLNGFYEKTKARLSPYDCVLVRKFSMDAVRDFQDRSLDFVYIDGNHGLMWVIEDLYMWSRKVRSGGIVSGHDYKRVAKPDSFHCHVVDAVFAFTACYKINPWFVLGTKNPVFGEVRDETRSYMWVQP